MPCSMTKGVGLQFDSACVSSSGRSARELSDGISLGSGAGGSVDLTYHALFYDEGRRPTVWQCLRQQLRQVSEPRGARSALWGGYRSVQWEGGGGVGGVPAAVSPVLFGMWEVYTLPAISGGGMSNYHFMRGNM